MTSKTALIVSLLLAGLCLPGCAAWSTYPAIPGAMQVGHPEFEPLPTIMAEAVRYSNERYLKADEPTFNLPEGVTKATYDSVKQRLRGGRAMLDPDEPAVHIKQIRVRGGDAQVDVIFPRDDGLYQFVTLHMKQRFLNRFEVRDTRLWRIHVKAPEPNYPKFLEQPAVDPQDRAPEAMATVLDDE